MRTAILYASVGTGHKTAARALVDWFSIVSPESRVICLDTLAYLTPLVRKMLTRSYLEMVRKAPRLWGYFYDSTDDPAARDGVIASVNEMTERLNLSNLRKQVADFRPDAMIFTHFFGAQALVEAMNPPVPAYYVNTDFLSHVYHRNPSFSGWFVPAPETVLQHKYDGLDTDNVYETGIPVAPEYCAPPSREECRKILGYEPGEPVALVMGGGIGVGPVEEVVASLSQYPGMRITVICGTNTKLAARMEERYGSSGAVRVEGFVEGMIRYYAASDMVFMKPGGLSSSEALCMKIPIVLTDPIPGQEQRNSDYLLDRGAARVLFEYRQAASRAGEILNSKRERQRLAVSAGRCARPYAGRDITGILMELHKGQ